jgi:hypothetical protein
MGFVLPPLKRLFIENPSKPEAFRQAGPDAGRVFEDGDCDGFRRADKKRMRKTKADARVRLRITLQIVSNLPCWLQARSMRRPIATRREF